MIFDALKLLPLIKYWKSIKHRNIADSIKKITETLFAHFAFFANTCPPKKNKLKGNRKQKGLSAIYSDL